MQEITDNQHFEFAIIGAGAAGLHLCMAIIDQDFLGDKKVLIIEKDNKTENDRTWSFWEKTHGKWDKIIHHAWQFGEFHNKDFSKKLDLKNYRYKTLRSSKFYHFAKKKISESSNFIWIKDEVIKVEYSTTSPPLIQTHYNKYTAAHIFDSRIDNDFLEGNDQNVRILQHFRGWFIKTPKPVFNPNNFVMMDFRIKWENQTSFTYVLPFSEHEAMVEFTLFNKKMLEPSDYDQKLKQYIHEILNIDEYEIVETEMGVIPMTDFPFFKKNNKQLTKIGTAGGWVKPSSGYAFKNCERLAGRVAQNLKNNKLPSRGLFKKRYQWYDRILLEILNSKNELMPSIFGEMYQKNDITEMFKFLDNEGTLASDLGIIKSFHPMPFLKALWRNIKKSG